MKLKDAKDVSKLSLDELSHSQRRELRLLDDLVSAQTQYFIEPEMFPKILHALDVAALPTLNVLAERIINSLTSAEDIAQVVAYCIARFSRHDPAVSEQVFLSNLITYPLRLHARLLHKDGDRTVYAHALIRDLLAAPNLMANRNGLTLLTADKRFALGEGAQMLEKLAVLWITTYRKINTTDQDEEIEDVQRNIEMLAESLRQMAETELRVPEIDSTSQQLYSTKLLLLYATLSSSVRGGGGLLVRKTVNRSLMENETLSLRERGRNAANLMLNARRLSLIHCPLETLSANVDIAINEISETGIPQDFDPTLLARHNELVLNLIDALCQRSDIANVRVQKAIEFFVANLENNSIGLFSLIHQFVLPCFGEKENLARAIINSTIDERQSKPADEGHIFEAIEQSGSIIAPRIGQALYFGTMTSALSINMQELLANLLNVTEVSARQKLAILDRILDGIAARPKFIYGRTPLIEIEVAFLGSILEANFPSRLIRNDEQTEASYIRMHYPIYYTVIEKAQALLDSQNKFTNA